MSYCCGSICKLSVCLSYFVNIKKVSRSLTEYTEPVVHGHHNHVAVSSQDAGIKHVSGAFHVGASVNKQHHRLLPAVTDIYTHTYAKGRKQGIESKKEKKSITVFTPLIFSLITYCVRP